MPADALFGTSPLTEDKALDINVAPDPPLHGIRVVEMGQLIAGPFVGSLLADFGADVVKLEPPGDGDPMRQWGCVKDGRSLSWAVISRNKRCVVADLRTADGQQFARDLIGQADILVENFRPGTLERFNLEPEDLRTDNPGLIIVRVSGYGQTGPYSPRAGYGAIGEAMGGLRQLVGEPDRPPSRVGISIGDSLAGMRGALGALVALAARQRTGVGDVVDVSIYESVLGMMEALVPDYAVGGLTRQRTGSTLPGIAPSNVYPTRSGEHILIAANQDTVFKRLAEAMSRPELGDDPRFATHLGRGEHSIELDGIIAEWSVTKDAQDVLDTLETFAVPAGRMYRAEHMLEDPHFKARESIEFIPDRDLGDVPMPAVFPKLTDRPGVIKWIGRDRPGTDTDAVRDEWLPQPAAEGTPG